MSMTLRDLRLLGTYSPDAEIELSAGEYDKIIGVYALHGYKIGYRYGITAGVLCCLTALALVEAVKFFVL